MTFLKRGIAVLLGLGVLLIVWGLAEPYIIDEQRFDVALPYLPPSLAGERVAVIADLQVGMWLDNTRTIKRVVQRIVTERPVAVLIAGDFVYHASASQTRLISEVVELLKPLTDANIPTYAVLGNHDYAMPTRQAAEDEDLARVLRESLEDAQINVLQNEAASIPSEEGTLYIVGVGSHIAGESDPKSALAQVPGNAARLALMHHPKSFKAFPANTAPLAVAGHTHGGQFRLPFTPSWTWMSYMREDEVHADGFIDNYGEAGNKLYVNRGIGFSVAPLRFNCQPELSFFTLRGK